MSDITTYTDILTTKVCHFYLKNVCFSCNCVETWHTRLVLYEEELGGQDRVLGGIQVTCSALVGHNEESNITDNIQLLQTKHGTRKHCKISLTMMMIDTKVMRPKQI